VWTSELILQLISNPAKKCPPDVLNQLQQVLKNLSGYFSFFERAEEIPQGINLVDLTDYQLKPIDDLDKKVKEYNLASSVFLELPLIPRLQPNSIETIQFLKNEVAKIIEDELNKLSSSLLQLEPLMSKLGEE